MNRPDIGASRALTILCVVVLGLPNATHAQARLAEGRLLRATESGRPAPVAGEYIVLHRVGTDRAAPLDSVRSGADGRFRFRYQRTGDPQALYFVSARYEGIAYFSPPLRADTVRGEDADIIVYATTSDTSTLRTQGRHLVVSAPRGSDREIAEVFELENSGFRTIIARDSTNPLWSIGLPDAARNPSVAPGDVAAAAIVFRDGRAELYAPISPGVRQFVVTYQLPIATTALSIPTERELAVLEVLLEEPRATVEGAGLREVAPAPIEDRQFHRFLAQDAPAHAVVRVTVPAPVSQNRSVVRMLGLAVALIMIAALATWLLRRRRATPVFASGGAPPAVAQSQVDRLIADLATLDARFEREQTPSADMRGAYERDRADLKARIAAALAEEEQRS
ncbi:MAG: hypothetical protein ACREOK_11510 [Gemmatimonadaceae bacterium]